MGAYLDRVIKYSYYVVDALDRVHKWFLDINVNKIQFLYKFENDKMS